MMIDTLMAFWNQNRRRRAAQVLLTFFLMCISISLLFVVMSLPQWSHTHPQNSITGRAGNKGSIGTGVEGVGKVGKVGKVGATTPTVIVQITQGPQVKPTSTIIVPSQATPTPVGGTSSCTTPDTQVNFNATINTASQYTEGNTVTPAETAIISTGTPVTTVTTSTATNGMPLIPAQQQGGGPINSGTPVSASPVPGSTQHIGGGWISACNGNDIGMIGGANIVSVIWQNIWLILGVSLACTALFYGIVWYMNKNRL